MVPDPVQISSRRHDRLRCRRADGTAVLRLLADHLPHIIGIYPAVAIEIDPGRKTVCGAPAERGAYQIKVTAIDNAIAIGIAS